MAFFNDDKTEAPTPRRRQQARERGQVAKSQDLSSAVLLMAGFLGLYLFGPDLWFSLLAVLKTALIGARSANIDEATLLASAMVVEMAKRLAPYLAIVFAAVLAVLYAQTGWILTLKPVTPSLSKLNPINGVKRLFSGRMAMAAVANFGKLAVVTLIAYLSISGGAAAILFGSTLDIHDAFRLSTSMVFGLSMRLGVALILLALLDYAWQRFRHEKDLRMTKEEVKDEMRSMDGDPKLKQRRREVQLQLALQRLRRDVPQADVVVTNPTHVAVAIRYDNARMAAPKVVAKGVDFLALRIRQIAMECGVPVVERPPLARALYDAADIGDVIPERFYRAIAEILAYVYELSGRSPSKARPTAIGV